MHLRLDSPSQQQLTKDSLGKPSATFEKPVSNLLSVKSPDGDMAKRDSAFGSVVGLAAAGNSFGPQK